MNRSQAQANKSIAKVKDMSLKKLRSYGYDIQVVLKDVLAYEEFGPEVEMSISDLVEDRIEDKTEKLDLEKSRRFYNLYADGQLILKEANEEELFYLLSMEHSLKIAKMDQI